MKRIGIEALYRKPNTSKPTLGHKIYPYLLRGMSDRPSQTGLGHGHHLRPLARGFVYLAAVVDWFSRRVLAWRVSITLEAAFCVEALEDALARHGRPEIFNTDQGSQFTSHDFTGVLLKAGIAISMDGKGSWRDNVFVERLWRSIKYEEVYLRAYETVSEARASIGRYLTFYNGRRPHSSLDRQTPDQAYFTRLPHIRSSLNPAGLHLSQRKLLFRQTYESVPRTFLVHVRNDGERGGSSRLLGPTGNGLVGVSVDQGDGRLAVRQFGSEKHGRR